MSLGHRIKDKRRVSGMTQPEFAELVGVSLTTIRRWEGGTTKPDADMLQKIAHALDTSTSYLLGETDDPVRYNPSLLMAAGKKPEELDGNKPPEPSSDLARRMYAIREWFDKRGASSSLGLTYWASVVDNARDAVLQADPQELAEVREMLEKALASLDEVTRKQM